jgi:hypothetical protein
VYLSWGCPDEARHLYAGESRAVERVQRAVQGGADQDAGARIGPAVAVAEPTEGNSDWTRLYRPTAASNPRVMLTEYLTPICFAMATARVQATSVITR